MSHTSVISSPNFKNLDLLIRAAEAVAQERGYELTVTRNASPKMYFKHQKHQCDVVFSCKGFSYELGAAYNQQTDSYELICDTHGGYISKQWGNKNGATNELMNAYTVEQCREFARDNGGLLDVTRHEDDTLTLEIAYA